MAVPSRALRLARTAAGRGAMRPGQRQANDDDLTVGHRLEGFEVEVRQRCQQRPVHRFDAGAWDARPVVQRIVGERCRRPRSVAFVAADPRRNDRLRSD